MEDVPEEAREDKLEDKPKNDVWGPLLQQYKVDLIHKLYILQQMGRLWRAYKSELTSSVMTVLDSLRSRTETARLLGLIKPADVPQAEWDAFVAERSSGEWKAKSEKMMAVRAKQLLPHTLSRKGYAREEYEHKLKTGQTRCRTRSFLKGHEKSKNKYVQEKCAEMEAKLAQQPPTEGPIPVKHDVLSQVLGKEKNGLVRGMGAGITPPRVDAQLQTGCWKQAFEERLEANYERTKMLEEIVFRLTGARTSTASVDNVFVGSETGSMGTSSHGNAQDAIEIGEKETTPSPMTRNSKSVQGSYLQQLGVNQPCNILDLLGTYEVVAKGRIASVDPLTTVHGYKLRPDCDRVEIEEAINPRAELYCFQLEFSAMEDAIGSTIAWPIKYIAPRT